MFWSDLDLHCLPMSFYKTLGVTGLNINFITLKKKKNKKKHSNHSKPKTKFYNVHESFWYAISLSTKLNMLLEVYGVPGRFKSDAAQRRRRRLLWIYTVCQSLLWGTLGRPELDGSHGYFFVVSGVTFLRQQEPTKRTTSSISSKRDSTENPTHKPNCPPISLTKFSS